MEAGGPHDSGGLYVYRATCTAGMSCAAAVPAVGSANVTVGHADPFQAFFTPDPTHCAEYWSFPRSGRRSAT